MADYDYNYWHNLIFNRSFGLDLELEESVIRVIDTYWSAVLHEYSDVNFLVYLIEQFDSLGLIEDTDWSVTTPGTQAQINLLSAGAVVAYWDIHDDFYNIDDGNPSSALVTFEFNGQQYNSVTAKLYINDTTASFDFLNSYKYPGAQTSWLYINAGESANDAFLRAYYGTYYYDVEVYDRGTPPVGGVEWWFGWWVQAIISGSYPQLNLFDEDYPRDIRIQGYDWHYEAGSVYGTFRVRAMKQNVIIAFTNSLPSGSHKIVIKVGDTIVKQINYGQTQQYTFKRGVTYTLIVGYGF